MRRTGNGSPNRRPRPQAEGAVAPPRTPAPEAEGQKEADEAAPESAQADPRRDFTKPPWRRPRLFGAGRPAERQRPRESPRGSSRPGNGRASAPTRSRKNGSVEAASPWRRARRRAAKLSGGAAIRKGFSEGFGPGRFLERRQASGPRQSTTLTGPVAGRFSKGRPEGLRPRCEPWRRRGFGRAGSARDVEAGFRFRRSDPEGIGEGPRLLFRNPSGTERGFAASLRNP